MGSRQSSLGFLNFTTEFLHSTVVLSDVLALLLLVQLDEMLHHSLVKIFTTQVSVTVGGDDLKYSVVNGQQTHIKSTTTKIKDQDVLLSIFLVKTVSNSRSSWLIDDSHDVESSNGS